MQTPEKLPKQCLISNVIIRIMAELRNFIYVGVGMNIDAVLGVWPQSHIHNSCSRRRKETDKLIE